MTYIDIKQHILFLLDIKNKKAKVLANDFIEYSCKYKQYEFSYSGLQFFLQDKLKKKYFKKLRPILTMRDSSKVDLIYSSVIVDTPCEYADMSDEEFEKLENEL